MTEVVAALIWDDDKFMRCIRQERYFGNSPVARWN